MDDLGPQRANPARRWKAATFPVTCHTHVIRDASGRVVGSAITCTRGRKVRRCGCGNVAEFLCDYALRGAKQGKTCDAPLCRGCATEVDFQTHLCRPHAKPAADDKWNKAKAEAWLADVIRAENREALRAVADAAAAGRIAGDALRAYGERVVADMAASINAVFAAHTPRAVEDPNAVDRQALVEMFPQWPDIAPTYDNRREACRADVMHGDATISTRRR